MSEQQDDIEINKSNYDTTALSGEDNIEDEEYNDDAAPDTTPDEPAEEKQEPLSAEEALIRRQLIMKLRAYVNKFPKHFNGIDWREFTYYNKERLEATLEEMKYIVGRASDASMVHGIAYAGFMGLEQLSSFTPLKLSGLSNVAARDEAIQDILNEISIEYGCFEIQSPEHRLMAAVAKAVLLTHQLNTAREKQDEAELARKLAKEVTSDLIEKSKEL